jgi:hypothetical protein
MVNSISATTRIIAYLEVNGGIPLSPKGESLLPLSAMSDKLALWAAKLNELEIGRFVPAGNAIIYSGTGEEEIEIIHSKGDGVHYSVLCLGNTVDWPDPIPRFILFSLSESDQDTNSVIFPHPYSPFLFSPLTNIRKRPLETWLLTAAVGTAIGWELLGRKHTVALSLIHGAFISSPYPCPSPYEWEINVPFFSVNTNPANYNVTLVILFFDKGKKPHQCWDYRLKLPPRDLVSLGYDGINRLITLATL